MDKIQPEKLVDPLFRDGLMEDLGPGVWSVAEPQVQTAVAVAITDNFLLAAGIVAISVLAILRMREIRLRGAEPLPAVSVERPEPPKPSNPNSRLREIPILERKAESAGVSNGFAALSDVVELQAPPKMGAVAPVIPSNGGTAQPHHDPLRRTVVAAAMVGAGMGVALSILTRRQPTSGADRSR